METISLILAILIVIAVLVWDVKSDYNKWRVDIPVNHGKDMALRIGLLTPAFLGFAINHFTIANIFIIPLMVGAWYWELFDGFYNKIRGFSWRFNGSDDLDDAASDNILQKMNPIEQGITKWGLIILFTLIYILS